MRGKTLNSFVSGRMDPSNSSFIVILFSERYDSLDCYSDHLRNEGDHLFIGVFSCFDCFFLLFINGAEQNVTMSNKHSVLRSADNGTVSKKHYSIGCEFVMKIFQMSLENH